MRSSTSCSSATRPSTHALSSSRAPHARPSPSRRAASSPTTRKRAARANDCRPQARDGPSGLLGGNRRWRAPDRGSHLVDLCDALSLKIDEFVATESDERLSLDGVVPHGVPTLRPDAVVLGATAFLLDTAESERHVDATLRPYPRSVDRALPAARLRVRTARDADGSAEPRVGAHRHRRASPAAVLDLGSTRRPGRVPAHLDEYDWIAHGLLSELHRGTPLQKLTRWLQRAETELIGDSPARSAQRELLAHRVDRWYDDSRSYWLDHQPRPAA